LEEDFQDDFYFEEEASEEQNLRAYGSTSLYSHSKKQHRGYSSRSGYHSQQHGTNKNNQQQPLIHNFRKRHPIFVIPNILDWKKSNSGILSFD